jgi:putative addiction module component (TIGR02574 family)
MNNSKDSPALPEFHELTDDLSIDSAWDIASLSREHRIDLMSRIWQSLAAEPEKIALTPQQKQILDQRLAKLDEYGSTGIPATEVFAKLRVNRA